MDDVRIPPAGDPFYAAAHRPDEERACFYCLDGWVFMGGLSEDGEEEYYPVYCRRCGGSGVLQAS